MFKIVVALSIVCAITAQVIPPTGIRRIRPGPVIQTQNGPIQGQEETYDVFRRIYTFKGIRYAQPPTGNLRFRQAVPPAPWTQVFQAWEYGPRCPQFGLVREQLTGEEDCLFLNVATPTNIRSRLPVVVGVHGGGLHIGNGEMSFLGPELFNQENIISVVFNYRLGVLGFLNSGDRFAPGNFGIKDMITVLQWVRDNIESFGGDPNDVTIIGSSGGAVGVNALVVSEAARGLFHKAVAQSGSILSPWAFNANPVQYVDTLVRDLQLHVTSSEDTINQLRQVSLARLMNAVGGLDADAGPFNEINFMPSIDPVDSQEPIIFSAPIVTLIRNGNINQVPYITGYVSAESLYAIPRINGDPTFMERFNQNPNLLIPREWNIAPNSAISIAVITTFRNIYFGGAQVLTAEHAQGWANYESDREYNFPVSKIARLHRQRQPVYYYRFSYDGAMNFFKPILSVTDYEGAVHGDDAFYLFRLNAFITPVPPGDEAFLIQRRVVRMWSNFIKFGNPTVSALDPLIGTTWPQLTENEEFMDIDAALRVDVHPFRDRLEIWHLLDQQFNP